MTTTLDQALHRALLRHCVLRGISRRRVVEAALLHYLRQSPADKLAMITAVDDRCVEHDIRAGWRKVLRESSDQRSLLS
jgi:hypothetical protein